MKNAIHNYYEKKHRDDPKHSFEDCLDRSKAVDARFRKWWVPSAVAASLVLGFGFINIFSGETTWSGGEAVLEQSGQSGVAQTATQELQDNFIRREQLAQLSAPDREMFPSHTEAPVYPEVAEAEGIEGWVQLRFTVTARGEVQNPEVVEADPPDIFNQSALDAILNYRFEPRISGGQAVEVEGVQYVFRYTLD